MSEYLVSDIHGEYDKLMEMLLKIGFNKDDHMYILGDNIDRGSKNLEVIDFIMANDNVESLMGNHELMMLNYFSNFSDLRDGLILNKNTRKMLEDCYWGDNGGKETLKQLIQRESNENGYLNKMIDFIKRWDYYKLLSVCRKDFLLIHAGYKYRDDKKSIEEMLEYTSNEDKVWIRGQFYRNKAIESVTTIFGHTRTYSLGNDNKIWHDKIYKDKIGIDCGVAYSGKLACLKLDDLKEFYV